MQIKTHGKWINIYFKALCQIWLILARLLVRKKNRKCNKKQFKFTCRERRMVSGLTFSSSELQNE